MFSFMQESAGRHADALGAVNDLTLQVAQINLVVVDQGVQLLQLVHEQDHARVPLVGQAVQGGGRDVAGVHLEEVAQAGAAVAAAQAVGAGAAPGVGRLGAGIRAGLAAIASSSRWARRTC